MSTKSKQSVDVWVLQVVHQLLTGEERTQSSGSEGAWRGGPAAALHRN